MSEAQLTAWIENHFKGRVLSIERQGRWRPCWYAEMENSAGRKPLYIRSRRAQSELLFFPLAHEAEVLRVLHAAGIPSPEIYGMCPAPEAIVMDRMPGRSDLSKADSKSEQAAVLLDFMDILARMHAIPPEKFLGAGLEIPKDPRALAFVMFDRFEAIQNANKRRPAPEVTFIKKWVRANPPMHRNRPAFITCDSGQFMFKDGRVTSVLDMELAHIADPALDIASLLLRDLSEPLGDLTPGMKRYQELAGPIDWDVVKYYIVLWGVMTPMVTLHLSQDPPPELDHAYNDDQTFVLTRIPLEMMAELMGVALDPMPPPYAFNPNKGGSVALRAALAALRGAVRDVTPEDAFQLYRRNCASDMADYLGLLIEYEGEVLAEDRREAAHLLGRDIADEDARNAALEQFVLDAGPERDADLVRVFYRRMGRREALLGPKPKLFPLRAIQRPDRALT